MTLVDHTLVPFRREYAVSASSAAGTYLEILAARGGYAIVDLLTIEVGTVTAAGEAFTTTIRNEDDDVLATLGGTVTLDDGQTLSVGPDVTTGNPGANGPYVTRRDQIVLYGGDRIRVRFVPDAMGDNFIVRFRARSNTLITALVSNATLTEDDS